MHSVQNARADKERGDEVDWHRYRLRALPFDTDVYRAGSRAREFVRRRLCTNELTEERKVYERLCRRQEV